MCVSECGMKTGRYSGGVEGRAKLPLIPNSDPCSCHPGSSTPTGQMQSLVIDNFSVAPCCINIHQSCLSVQWQVHVPGKPTRTQEVCTHTHTARLN